MRLSTSTARSRRNFLFTSLSLVGAAAGPTRALALTNVTATSTVDDTVTPMLYAIRDGLFENTGLHVTLEKTSSGGAITSAVISGAYDIGKSSLVPLFNAHLRGLPIVIIAAGGLYDAAAPYGELVVAKNSPLASAKDLEDKTIGVSSLNDLNTLVTRAWVAKNGGDWRSLRYVELPMSAAVAALGEGRIDATVLLYPALAHALADATVKVLAPALNAIAPHFLMSAWFTTNSWAASNRETIATFTKTLEKAAAYTNAYPEATAQMISEYTKIPLSVIEHMPRIKIATSLNAGEIQPLVDAAVKYKTLPSGFPAAQLIE